MAKQLKLKIVTPERLILEETVDHVSVPTTLGEITILPEHIPLITELASGDVVAFSRGEHIPVAIVGGFVEVKSANSLPGTPTEFTLWADCPKPRAGLTAEKIGKPKGKA